MKKIKVGLIGFGTIGSGVAEVLKKKGKLIKERSGLNIVIEKVCDTNLKVRRLARKNTGAIVTKSADDILYDSSIDMVIELIGGIKAAKDVVLKAIKMKKHVITANKALLAIHGKEIFKLAEKNGVSVGFEASVAGGIPIIKALREGLVSSRIDTIYGIINGTSNFILTEMGEDKYSFKKALAEAKKKGFAEANPKLDINGVDSAHKLAILALLGFKFPVNFKDIHVEGIEDIEQSDIEYANGLGYEVKLLAIAKRVGDKLEVRVHPTLLPAKYVLSSVKGIYNAIFVRGDLIGRSLFYGKGAGKYPTAGAVISDIIDIGKKAGTGVKDYILAPDTKNKIKGVKKFGKIETRYYVRFGAIDKPGVLAKVSGVLARHHISIASVTQKERKEAQVVPIVMMTHRALEENMREALKEIKSLGVIKGKPVRIRVEN